MTNSARSIILVLLFFILLIFILMTPKFAQAGTASFIGTGEVQSPAEMVTLTVAVSSECFPSALAASKANDEIAQRVLQLLNSHVHAEAHDEVTATGGYVERYTGYRPINNQPICIQQFKKQNQLTLKVHSVESFDQTFAKLQDELYSLGMDMPPDAIDKPTSFLEIAQPLPRLTPETQTRLERKALTLALTDAKEKFQITLSLAGVTRYKIVNYAEAELGQRTFPNEAERNRAVSESPAPIQFGELKVRKTLNVKFEYEGLDLEAR